MLKILDLDLESIAESLRSIAFISRSTVILPTIAASPFLILLRANLPQVLANIKLAQSLRPH